MTAAIARPTVRIETADGTGRECSSGIRMMVQSTIAGGSHMLGLQDGLQDLSLYEGVWRLTDLATVALWQLVWKPPQDAERLDKGPSLIQDSQSTCYLVLQVSIFFLLRFLSTNLGESDGWLKRRLPFSVLHIDDCDASSSILSKRRPDANEGTSCCLTNHKVQSST